MDAIAGPPTAPETASSPRRPEHGVLAQFMLSLIKAMIQTGYYAAGHPEAKKAFSSLYREFRQVIGERSELTCLLAGDQSGRTILIDSYEATPLPLDQVMMKGMAELFTRKFIEFFDRRALLSFSLKADLTAEEFQAFVELMAQPPVAGPDSGHERQRLTQAFLDHHILHISTVFNDDLVGRERRLSWRVQMALSRLRRDLRMLPLYQRATPEQIRRIKIQIIDDVVRPVRAPELLTEFLLNCDLVAADIAVLEETQVEREIMARLSKEMLPSTLRQFLKELDRVAATREGPSPEVTRRLDIVRHIVERLRADGCAIEHDLLESLLERQVISLEDLPPDLRRTVETSRLTEAFLAAKDAHVAALGRIAADEAGTRLAAVVSQVFPELLRRRDYQVVAELLRAIREGARDPTTSPILERLAAQLRQAAAAEQTIACAIENLGRQDKAGRSYLVEILAFIGGAAGPGLVEAYATSDNRSVRVDAFEALRQIGARALKPFLARLPDIEREWLMIRHALLAAADLGDTSLAQPIAKFLHHSHAHVRQAALTACFKLEGARAEPHFLGALRDRDAAVRQTAVECLGRMQSRHAQALEFYARSLDLADPAAPLEDDAVLVQVCQAVASLGGRSPEQASRAEAMLLAALQPSAQKGLLGRLKKTHHRHSDQVRASLCKALGIVGTARAVGLLGQVAATERSMVGEAARAAASEIEERASRSAVV